MLGVHAGVHKPGLFTSSSCVTAAFATGAAAGDEGSWLLIHF